MNVMDDGRVRQLVETIQRLDMLRGEAKESAREYRERIEVLDEEVARLAESIRSGQGRLFESAALVEAAAKVAPQPGSAVESVTVTHAGKSVTLTAEDGKRMRAAAGALRRKQRARA
jgi:hypothetical protein